MIHPRTQTTEVRSSGDSRNGIPRTFYTYRGDGHDAVNPDDCGCGNCGNKIRAANQRRTEDE